MIARSAGFPATVIPAGGAAEEPGSSAMCSARTRTPNDPGYGLRPFRDDEGWTGSGSREAQP